MKTSEDGRNDPKKIELHVGEGDKDNKYLSYKSRLVIHFKGTFNTKKITTLKF